MRQSIQSGLRFTEFNFPWPLKAYYLTEFKTSWTLFQQRAKERKIVSLYVQRPFKKCYLFRQNKNEYRRAMMFLIMNSTWYDRTPQSMALMQTEMTVFENWFQVSESFEIKRSLFHINMSWKTRATFQKWIFCWSSLPELFFKNDVFKNFAKFTGKHLCRSLLNKVDQQLYEKETPTQVLSWDTKILRTPIFIE